MLHSLGEHRIRIWWGRWRSVSLHEPYRYYYMFRNSILLWRRPYIQTDWKRADKLRIIFMMIFFSLFSPNRLEIFFMMVKGIIDGYKGKHGDLMNS